jgi:soluble lytic murein transglycosylase
MRQESRFVMNAKSSVGAKGLMQLMPATAKWVAQKIHLSGFHPARVTEMDTNVTLGTHYMKMVLDSLDNHPVLASAAYNAGPGRARKWRAERPLEGAIYAETIPFAETRDYVKKVMSNAVYYNTLFEGKPQSLKATLGVIGARGQGENGVEQLP